MNDYDASSSYYEDNKGGDYITIRHMGDGNFLFEIGNCCVVTIRISGTISKITEKLTKL